MYTLLKAIFPILFFLSIGLRPSASFSLNQNKISKWSQDLSAYERAVLADEFIFEYKYSSPKQTDSLLHLLYQEAKTNHLLAWTFYINSAIKIGQSDFDQALRYLDSAQTYSREPYLFVQATIEKAKTYTILGQLHEARVSFEQSLKLTKHLNEKQLLCDTYASLGEFYRKSAQFETALSYLDSAQALVDEHQLFSESNIDILDRKAAVYAEMIIPDSTEKYAYAALKLAQEQENKHAQAVSHNELGYFYENRNNIDSSFVHYNQAIAIWQELKAYRYLVNAQLNKARVLFRNKELKKTEKLLLEAKEISEKQKWLEIYPRLYGSMAMVYQERGDSLGYYKFQQKATKAEFEWYRIETDKKIHLLEKEKLQHIPSPTEKQSSPTQNKQYLQLIIFSIISAVLVGIIFFLLVTKRKNRS
ncbi:MAG: hypothetical protein WDZ35_16310 [Crocinitomicaceae bacterium]